MSDENLQAQMDTVRDRCTKAKSDINVQATVSWKDLEKHGADNAPIQIWIYDDSANSPRRLMFHAAIE